MREAIDGFFKNQEIPRASGAQFKIRWIMGSPLYSLCRGIYKHLNKEDPEWKLN